MSRVKTRPLYINYKIITFKAGLVFKVILPALISKIVLPKIHFPRFKYIAITGVFLIAFFTISGVIFWLTIMKDLPSAGALTDRNIELTSKVYDRNGELLYSFYKDQNRTLITLDRVPKQVQLATLAAEDANFYNHSGISIKGIIRAAIIYLKEGKVTGGSTITQQLVKNALLSPEKTITRKLKEMVISMEVERKYSKDKILEMYLNEVSYGGTAFGIEEAARLYFDKDVENLNLSEAALLAGLPKSPTELSPFGTTPEFAIKRRNEILDLMANDNFISQKLAEDAKAEKLTFAPDIIKMQAPHFVMYIRNLLAQKYGDGYLEKSGLEVHTTLDMRIQRLAQEAVSSELVKIKHLNVTNAAALVLDPKTGEILAMVGSENYFDTKNDGNVNVVLQPRQPGSSIKIVNYANALSNGLTAATIIDDTPAVFQSQGQPPYIPKDYDGKFRGPITLRSALAESRNIPAVKVLNKFGVKSMIDMGKKMGITTWDDEKRFGLSLTLGGGEVKLIDLSRAYATLADYGKRPEIWSISSINSSDGKTIYQKECCSNVQVLDPRVAFILTDILKDNNARTPAFGAHSALVIPKHPEVAVKTGTSNDLRDNLTLGYSQDYLVAVWVGNNNNSPMSRIASGITGAAPIWNRIMQGLLADKESVAWNIPDGTSIVGICPQTGTLPCSGCKPKTEFFLSENAPQNHCSEEKLAKKNIKDFQNQQGSHELSLQAWE